MAGGMACQAMPGHGVVSSGMAWHGVMRHAAWHEQPCRLWHSWTWHGSNIAHVAAVALPVPTCLSHCCMLPPCHSPSCCFLALQMSTLCLGRGGTTVRRVHTSFTSSLSARCAHGMCCWDVAIMQAHTHACLHSEHGQSRALSGSSRHGCLAHPPMSPCCQLFQSLICNCCRRTA